MTETFLELQAVEVSYGQARALNGVSLAVPKGRIVSLLGGNASGKSTTMKTILGLVRPDAGRVLLDGKDITTWPTSRRVASGIASVPEARRIFAPMTVEETLVMGAYTRRDKTGIRDDLAAQVSFGVPTATALMLTVPGPWSELSSQGAHLTEIVTAPR